VKITQISQKKIEIKRISMVGKFLQAIGRYNSYTCT